MYAKLVHTANSIWYKYGGTVCAIGRCSSRRVSRVGTYEETQKIDYIQYFAQEWRLESQARPLRGSLSVVKVTIR